MTGAIGNVGGSQLTFNQQINVISFSEQMENLPAGKSITITAGADQREASMNYVETQLNREVFGEKDDPRTFTFTKLENGQTKFSVPNEGHRGEFSINVPVNQQQTKLAATDERLKPGQKPTEQANIPTGGERGHIGNIPQIDISSTEVNTSFSETKSFHIDGHNVTAKLNFSFDPDTGILKGPLTVKGPKGEKIFDVKLQISQDDWKEFQTAFKDSGADFSKLTELSGGAGRLFKDIGSSIAKTIPGLSDFFSNLIPDFSDMNISTSWMDDKVNGNGSLYWPQGK